ncbi:STM4014 family protein [Aeoliella sp.]|uniref:STM4014 family protein n=1 Tax=Aeoliella sp. TaxID=2795800 RepID=UPI003CCBF3D7
MKSPRPWVIVCNPENRRVSMFQSALASRRLPPAEVRSYEGLLSGRESLDDLPARSIVRFDSPGENFSVERQLLAAGADAAEQEGSPVLSAETASRLDEDTGRILHPRQYHLGYMASCRRWFEAIAAQPGVQCTTSYDDLRTQFDKTLCSRSLAAAGVPAPESIGIVDDWDDLLQRMEQASTQRVFAKLANSSSASGVVAIEKIGGRVQAITSVEMVRNGRKLRLYNSLKTRCYTERSQVCDLINELARHRLHVERWLPKASLERRVFDLRVLVVGNQPRHMVVRTSRTPLTNLHLGNKRGDLENFLSQISEVQLASMLNSCRTCADVFSESLYFGLDVLFTPGFRDHYVLESNAFGDLLPGVTHERCDTYQAEVDAAADGLLY